MNPKKRETKRSAMAVVNLGCAQSSDVLVLCRARNFSAGRLIALPDAKKAADKPVAKLHTSTNIVSIPYIT